MYTLSNKAGLIYEVKLKRADCRILAPLKAQLLLRTQPCVLSVFVTEYISIEGLLLSDFVTNQFDNLFLYNSSIFKSSYLRT